MKIEYIKGVLATTLPDRILLHKSLQEKEYIHLKEKLLAHELHHKPGATSMKQMVKDGLSLDDLTLDLTFNQLDPDLITFILSHPDTLLQICGILPYQGRLYLDKSLIFTWLILFTTGGLTWLLV